MSERILQNYFKREAAKHDILWRKIKFEGRRGCPDVMIAAKGKIKLVEIKTPSLKGKLSALQGRQMQKFKDVGIEVKIVDSRRKVDAVIKDILK